MGAKPPPDQTSRSAFTQRSGSDEVHCSADGGGSCSQKTPGVPGGGWKPAAAAATEGDGGGEMNFGKGAAAG